jgi:hypothetical protein
MPQTVQTMFNGLGYDLTWLLSKAEYELGVTMREGTRFMENAANLSVSLAHMADWAFAFKPTAFSHCLNLEDVRVTVRTGCPEADLFLDIAKACEQARAEQNDCAGFALCRGL